MIINVIASHKDKEQEIFNVHHIQDMLGSEKEFIGNYWQSLPEGLKKMSMCITEIADNECVPGWFLNCRGKFFFENGKLL